MGKTSKPLVLRTTHELFTQYREQFDELIGQGHDIAPLAESSPIHYIGPNCWRMLDLEYLDVTIAAIRKELYDPTTRTRHTDTDSQRAPKRNPRKSKRQVAGSPARLEECGGDGIQHDGGIV